MGLRGPKPSGTWVKACRLPLRPILLKELVTDCDITQGDLKRITGASRMTVNICLNRAYIPTRRVPRFRTDIEQAVAASPVAMQWLAERGLSVQSVWQPGEPMWRKPPVGLGHRISRGIRSLAIVPGNPDDINEEENDMRKIKIPEAVLKHFKVFRDPFADDPRNDKEVFRSEEHRYIEYGMLDTAQNSGLIAVVAESGAGKTVMRRAVIDQLRRDQRVRIVFPQIIDKKKVTAKSLCEAIILDLEPDTKSIPNSAERCARRVKKLLIDRANQDVNVVMIIEEAHKLTIEALGYLKQFHELELGYKKLLGIILLGQPELGNLLDEEAHPEIRELIRRIQVAAITGLNGSLYKYLEHRFKVFGGGDIEKIITREAVDALSRRLTMAGAEHGKKFSIAYPLTVNNYVAMAMATAYDMKEPLITDSVIDAL